MFDQQGHKLLARVEPGRIAIYPVPNSPNDKPGRIRYVVTPAHDGTILAAGRVRRSVLTVNVVSDGTEVVVRRFGGSVTGPTGTFAINGEPILDAIDHPDLGRLTWNDGTLRVHLPTRQLTFAAPGAYLVGEADRSLRWRPTDVGSASATPTDAGWLIRFGSQEWWYRDGPVFGVFAAEGRASIIVIHHDGRTLVALGESGEREVLFSSSEKILDAVTHDRAPIVALRTESGRVVIRSWLHSGPRHEISPP